jgi:iron complex transport system ATP-binding protein
MLEVENLSVALGGRPVLTGVGFSVASGSWLGVVGANGAGKSTLLRAVLGLVPYEGRVRLAGREFRQGEHRPRARAAAYVAQRPALPPSMSVTDYVLLGRSAHHSYLGAETSRDLAIAAEVLDRLDLSALAGRALGQLSGGEAQRAVLARALVQEAPLLLMDEPTASLDLGHSQLVLELADQLRRERGLSVVCAMHDLTLAAQFSEQLLVIAGARRVALAPPAEVLTEANVRRFFGADVEVLAGAGGPVVTPVRRVRSLEGASSL